MYYQNNKIILHVSYKPQVLFDFVFLDISLMRNCVVSSNTKLLHFFYFLLLHLLISFLSSRHYSFSASFFFFFFSFLSSHLLLFLSFSLLFSSLHTDALWVLLYFFMGLFVFESVGFVWAYAEGGEMAARFLFMGCVFVQWLDCVSWVFKDWDQWIWVVDSGRRQSDSGSGSGSGSSQV